ncbi:MAG: hypothetical protein ACR2MO_16245 [Acidimicrobiales bacterium]
MRKTQVAAALVAVITLGGCGEDSRDISVPTTLATSTTTAAAGAATTVVGVAVTASADCQAAFQKGHDDEAAGTETFVAFRPSVQRCASLAEWAAAAKKHGAGLEGRAGVFVDRTCSSADADVKALPICQEAKGMDR